MNVKLWGSTGQSIFAKPQIYAFPVPEDFSNSFFYHNLQRYKIEDSHRSSALFEKKLVSPFGDNFASKLPISGWMSNLLSSISSCPLPGTVAWQLFGEPISNIQILTQTQTSNIFQAGAKSRHLFKTTAATPMLTLIAIPLKKSYVCVLTPFLTQTIKVQASAQSWCISRATGNLMEFDFFSQCHDLTFARKCTWNKNKKN